MTDAPEPGPENVVEWPREARNPLHAVLAEIMGATERLEKDATNTGGGNYKYTSEGAVLEAVRGPLAENGVTVIQAHNSILLTEESQTSTNKTMREVTVLFDFILTHAPSGTREVWPFAGVGSDTGDKWYSKASTSAEKFFIRRLFMMTSGDDPDGGGYERGAKQPEPKQEPCPDDWKPLGINERWEWLMKCKAIQAGWPSREAAGKRATDLGATTKTIGVDELFAVIVEAIGKGPDGTAPAPAPPPAPKSDPTPTGEGPPAAPAEPKPAEPANPPMEGQ